MQRLRDFGMTVYESVGLEDSGQGRKAAFRRVKVNRSLGLGVSCPLDRFADDATSIKHGNSSPKLDSRNRARSALHCLLAR